MICGELRLILRRRSLTPESGSSIRNGLNVYYGGGGALCMYKITWLKCILWGNRFPPTLCVGVGEAGPYSCSHI